MATKRNPKGQRVSTRRATGHRATRASPAKASAARTLVAVRWQGADGPKHTHGELVSLDDHGYLALTVGGADSLWIPQRRIFSISTRLESDAAVLEEETAAEAAAVIQAVAEGASGE